MENVKLIVGRQLRKLIPLLFIGLSLGVAPDAGAEDFFLFKDGRAMASLIVPDAYLKMPGERFDPIRLQTIPADVPTDLLRAVELFRRDLRVGYGIEMPIGEDSTMPNRIQLVVKDVPPLEQNRTRVSFPKENEMLIEGGEYGIIRTLFYILEEFGGARYLFQEKRDDIGLGAYFPAIKDLAIPEKPFERNSAFSLDRRTSQTTYGSQWPGLGNRAYYWNWEARLGMKAGIASGIDISSNVFPLKKYIADREKPDERIFPILQGKRVLPWKQELRPTSGWQPDYDNPETVKEAVKNILEFLRSHPETSSMSLSANMGGGFSETMSKSPSESYYRWVNQVVAEVVKVYPNVYFGVNAYREVTEPPSFRLHPNVVAYLTFAFQGTRDPEVRAKRVELIDRWAKVARIGTYCHNQGSQSYTLPRIYMEEAQDMLKYFHEHGAVAAFTERPYNTFPEGPRMYVYFKLLENPYLNLAETIKDWCAAAVGQDAAPYLRSYYAFWENFWKESAAKTSWWEDRGNIYLSAASYGPYMFALEEGDMAKCRKIMEKVVAVAHEKGSSDQKARADLLMKDFEYYEACAAASCGELFSNDGTLPDSKAAIRLLEKLPTLRKHQQRAVDIVNDHWLSPALTVKRQAVSDTEVIALSAIGEFLQDTEVRKKLQELKTNKDVSESVRFFADILLQRAEGKEVQNMDLGGGVEDDEHGWKSLSPSQGSVLRSDKRSANGTSSLRSEINHDNFTIQKTLPDAKPGKDYYFSARVFLDEMPPAGAYVNIMGQGMYKVGQKSFGGGRTLNTPNIPLKSGEWTLIGAIIPASAQVDSLQLSLRFPNLPPGAVAYVDDISVTELPGDSRTQGDAE